jgi:hypothetical protein
VVVGSATVTLSAGETRTVRISLNKTGKRLIRKRHKLKVTLRITQTLATGKATALLTKTLVFKAPRRHHHHH